MEIATEGRVVRNLDHWNCGDVMVVGGGISGTQTSLDLATAEYAPGVSPPYQRG